MNMTTQTTTDSHQRAVVKSRRKLRDRILAYEADVAAYAVACEANEVDAAKVEPKRRALRRALRGMGDDARKKKAEHALRTMLDDSKMWADLWKVELEDKRLAAWAAKLDLEGEAINRELTAFGPDKEPGTGGRNMLSPNDIEENTAIRIRNM
jgi:hypothetical protein